MAASAALAVAYGAVWVLRPESLSRSVLKASAVALLALAALADGAPGALTLALGLGALGDWCLSRPGQRPFLTGVAAFAAAHLALIWLMLGAGAEVALRSWPALGLLGLAAFMAFLLWRAAGALRGPVVAYVGIIAAMGLVALGLPEVYATGRWAAALFIFSDSLLAVEYFLARRESALRARVLWAAYWAAQALFLLSFAEAGGL